MKSILISKMIFFKAHIFRGLRNNLDYGDMNLEMEKCVISTSFKGLF